MMKHILLILSFLLLGFNIKAQSSYPIYVTPTLTPPYSLKLSDYSAVGSQNLMVSILVNDLDIVDLPVKLRIKMETVGVTIENPPTITTTPIYLNGGVTTILFGEDLEDYFKLNNLTFKGYGKDAYRNSGQLPGGFYKFTVEVLHFNTNRLISNSGTASAWIVLGKPPVLRGPDDNAETGQYVGMPITFSWLESNVGSPAAKGNIQYLFEMWEMRVDGVDPNTVVASMPVFHEYTTFNTLYPLYPSTLLMEPGMKYAWRVTASDVTGMVPFEQEGHSEVRTFTYKAKCDEVSDLCAEAKGKNGIFTWGADENHTSFNVEVQQPETGWMLNSETYDTKASYYDLEPGQTYQIRVQGVCNGDPEQVSDFSDWQSLTIPEPTPLVDEEECPDCGCDDDIPEVELTNFELKTVQPGDTIINKSGTTRFIVRSVNDQGSNTYSGVFLYWAEIWGVKIICNYENLQVNTDNVIVNMDFESVYDPQFIVDVDAVTDYVNDLLDDVAQITTGTEIKDSITYNGSFDQVVVRNDSVFAVSVAPDGVISEAYIDLADNLDKVKIIAKTNGEEVVISGNGQAMGVDEFTNTGGNSRLISNYNEEKESKIPESSSSMVGFSQYDKQLYGFDAYSDIKKNIQDQYPALNNGYRPAYKSLPAFGTDKVLADATEGLTFRDEMGIKAMGTGNELILRGSSADTEVPLYAYRNPTDSTEQVVGKLQMVSYTPQSKKLYIISVNEAPMPISDSLQSTLNKIYAQALTTWQVQALDPLNNLAFSNGTFFHGGSSAFATYNADQQIVLSAFEGSNRSFEDDAFYLFFIDNVQDKGENIAGYMPLQRQAGFIYGSPNLNTVAHELAHGAFNLYHTFSTNLNIAQQGKTQNLMDYNNGTELWKYQWDLIHDPQTMLFAWSQDESEGAKNLVKIDALFSWLKSNYGNTDVAYNYNQLNEQYIWDFAEAYNEFTYNEKSYSTIVWLTDKTTTVNITNPYVDIDLTGDFHVEFTIAFNFSGTSNEAIKFTTYTYQDFNAILGRIGIKLTDAYKKKITDKYTELFANTELTSDCNKIDVLFEGIPDFVLENISGTNRVGYIKTLLSCVVNEGGWIAGKRFDTNEELALLNLFRNFPTNETPDVFLEKISSEKVGGVPLVKVLVSSVDNKYLFIGDDSRKQLMIELLSLFSQTQTYKTFSSELNTKLSATTVDPAYAKQLSERTVAFDYKSIYARSWMDLKLGIVNVDPYLKIDADVNSQGKVSLNSYLCYGFVTTETAGIKNPREFSAFAPIIFDQKSTLGALEGFDKVFIAPAIFAYYADKEAGIKTATDVTQAGIDVATLLIPGGQLTKLGRVFFYADKISSITSLAAGFAETSENVKNVLSGISLVTGIVSVGENIVKPSQTEKLLIKSENLSKSKSVLQSEFKALVENINKLSPDELKQIEKAQENLAQFIDGYRKELGLSEDVTSEAIKKLKGRVSAVDLAYFPKIRKYLGNSRTKQYLNNEQLYAFEAVLRSSHPDVLKYIDDMDEFDFAEMVRGYRDLINNKKTQTFIDAVKSPDAFNGKYGWLPNWKITPGLKYSLTTIDDLREAGKLLPTGSATDIQLASLQAFTRKGDFINVPMRYNKSYLGEYAEKGYNHILECLEELRKLPQRKIVNERVYSGKAFSKADFESNFVGGAGKTHNYPSFVSTSKQESVAEGFVDLTKKWAGNDNVEKVAVIQRITSKEGVYIDDLSDWGENLGSVRHASEPSAIQRQYEVLLNPGDLKQVGEPIPIMENGVQKTIHGLNAYYVDFVQVIN